MFIILELIKISYKFLDFQNICGLFQLLIHNKKPMALHGLKINDFSLKIYFSLFFGRFLSELNLTFPHLNLSHSFGDIKIQKYKIYDLNR